MGSAKPGSMVFTKIIILLIKKAKETSRNVDICQKTRSKVDVQTS